jgi:hypothetical protein
MNFEKQENIQAILIEHMDWTLDEDEVWAEWVEYLKFVRGELTTRTVIPPKCWELLRTDLAEFVMYNLCVKEKLLSRQEMLVLMDLCCQYAYKNVTDLNPLELLCRIFTCSDPRFVMSRRHVVDQSKFIRGFKNARHALIEESIDFQE